VTVTGTCPSFLGFLFYCPRARAFVPLPPRAVCLQRKRREEEGTVSRRNFDGDDVVLGGRAEKLCPLGTRTRLCNLRAAVVDR
jgi:hypothetical protein